MRSLGPFFGMLFRLNFVNIKYIWDKTHALIHMDTCNTFEIYKDYTHICGSCTYIYTDNTHA